MGDDTGRWFLVNASPDLRAQIEANADLQPKGAPLRNTPIAGVLLTNADLDHVLGLFCLREGGPLHIYATRAVRHTLESCLGLERVLGAFCGAVWHEPPLRNFAPLAAGDGVSGSWLYRAIDLRGAPPRFAQGLASGEGHSVAYEFMDERTGGRLVVAPDVAEVNDELRAALRNSDAVLFDGTFWSADELSRIEPKAPTAAAMGHVTIKDCGLELLKGLPARQKAFIHINNSNPVLAPDSTERAAVEAAGITIGYDGWEFEL